MTDPRSSILTVLLLGVSLAGISTSVSAQSNQRTGRTSELGNGAVGQRQEMQDSAQNRNPRERLNTRIRNRLENRVRNRIDRNYDPFANATSPNLRADRRAREVGTEKPN